MKKVIAGFLIFIIFASIMTIGWEAYTVYQKLTSQNNAGNKDNNLVENIISGSKQLFFNMTKPVFASIQEAENSVKPSIPLAKIKVDELSNLSSFAKEEGIELTTEQKKFLEENGFFLTPNDIVGIQDEVSGGGQDDFTDTYQRFSGPYSIYFRQPVNSLFISSDTALHLYHILIDRSFQKIEEQKFQPMIREMSEALFKDSIANYNSATDIKLKESYKRLAVFYLVPLVVLDAGKELKKAELKPSDFKTYAEYTQAVSEQTAQAGAEKLAFSLNDQVYGGTVLSEEIFDLAKQELDLISAAKSIGPSPLFSPLRPEFSNDYSQFVPRSHYTKNKILKSYFIAMMWYGRMGFPLKSLDLTRDALIMTGQINNLNTGERKISDMWSDISAAVEFFVGETDDLTAYQYSSVIKKLYNGEINSDVLLDENFLNKFIANAVQDLPAPKILSEAISINTDGVAKEELLKNTMQFRFMGQRFTPDAYIINKLTQGDESPDPETGQKLPTMPTALMPISLLNPENNIVKGYLDQWINDPVRIKEQNRESDKVIAKFYNILKTEMSAYDSSIWTSNIYWSWLNCFKPLLQKYGEGYPFFMMNENWQRKNLGTVLGSYTELKHDTLLYAKQSYAEKGGGGPDEEIPPVPKGYVEPDLIFWNRIINLAKATKEGLTSRNIMPEEFGDRYDTFINFSEFFKSIAEKELANTEISDDDFEKLRIISVDLSQITAPLSNQTLTTKEMRAGIIADIHTDAVGSQILYEATGKPYIIYVAVKDINGARLTRGVVYSHYEFAEKIDGRLTDEDWQKKVYEGIGDLPKADAWSQALIK
jgi:hypothetical protein